MYYLIRNKNTKELAIWNFTWRTKKIRLVQSFTLKTSEKNTTRHISSDNDVVIAKAKHYKDLYFDAAMEELEPLPDPPRKIKFKPINIKQNMPIRYINTTIECV